MELHEALRNGLVNAASSSRANASGSSINPLFQAAPTAGHAFHNSVPSYYPLRQEMQTLKGNLLTGHPPSYAAMAGMPPRIPTKGVFPMQDQHMPIVTTSLLLDQGGRTQIKTITKDAASDFLLYLGTDNGKKPIEASKTTCVNNPHSSVPCHQDDQALGDEPNQPAAK
ncbi:hypothetical protein GOP47_0030925, partial [Adiantum capillus-veneris]